MAIGLLLLIIGINLICAAACVYVFWFAAKRQKIYMQQILREQFMGGAITDANIAQNIHDFVINEQIFDILKHLRPLAHQDKKLQLIVQKIEETEQSLRHISDDIFPAHLSIAFVRICEYKIQYLAELYEFAPEKIAVNIEGDFQNIKQPETLLGLYRLLISFVGNSLKHHQKAEITKIEVHLSLTNNVIRLAMQDNGLGFDIPKALAWSELMEHRGLADFQNLAIALSLGANQNDYEFYSIAKNLNLEQHGTFFDLKITLDENQYAA
jgi:signal transduction histidine kinase